uniref:Uncharacterized protein n=1 Tax=Oryza brachyantha TaxID=4533 RepID=J3KV43_ORYBR
MAGRLPGGACTRLHLTYAFQVELYMHAAVAGQRLVGAAQRGEGTHAHVASVISQHSTAQHARVAVGVAVAVAVAGWDTSRSRPCEKKRRLPVWTVRPAHFSGTRSQDQEIDFTRYKHRAECTRDSAA